MLLVHAVSFLFNALHTTRAPPWRTLTSRVLVDALECGHHVPTIEQRAYESGGVCQLKGGEVTRQLKAEAGVNSARGVLLRMITHLADHK